MNVTELARKLRTNPNELFTVLPEHGIDIGKRAIKIDDRTASFVVREWSRWKQERERMAKQTREKSEIEKAVAASGGSIKLPKVVNVRDFAARVNLPITRVISELMKNGILASMNERIDFETATIIAEDLGFKIEQESESGVVESGSQNMEEKLSALLAEEDDKSVTLEARPPVVVVMGHVDHGKTKLLDAIRSTNVIAGEAGGITQHIGAYQVTVPVKGQSSRASEESRGISNSRKITFIDTPGHEAFMTMRSRGARIADVAILVVAADDGVQPQTLEALGIIEAAKVPFVVAVNKIDKPDADIERVKRQLAEKNVQAEDWGGKIPFVPVSAKDGKNIDELLEMILLVADLNKDKLMANPERRAVATVVESHVDKNEGVVATILIAGGTMRVNDLLAIDKTLYGRVRAMRNWNGKAVKEAVPGMPVKLIGLKASPTVGDVIAVPVDAKGLERDIKEVSRASFKTVTSASAQTGEGDVVKKNVKIVLKTDVLGSLEALVGSFDKFKHPEVGVEVVSRGLGNVTDADILRAEATGARVYGFNVLIPTAVTNLAREKKVQIKTAKVIYEILDDVKAVLQELLPEEIVRTELGQAKIMAIFRTEKNAMIVGGVVTDGHAELGATVQVLRDDAEIETGEVLDLQSNKTAVKEVRAGSEFGTKIKIKPVLQIGDKLIFWHVEKKERKIQFS